MSEKGLASQGLHVDRLTVRFGSTVAVNGVSIDVARGSVLALVGPSGCGKSTLLRSVAGLVEPDEGSISWDGTNLTPMPTHERDFGLMFQDHALFGHRSVADNVGFGLKMAGVERAERVRRVDQLLELVGLDGFGPRSIEGLSGGEAQRVALARALAPEPRLLLLDEPLASLDRARRVELNAELARLLRELNQTAIYVTHDQEEAFAVADQIGVMDRGSLLRTGTPTDVWRDPQSETVARFLGHEMIIERDGQRWAVRSDAVALAAEAVADLTGTVQAVAFQGDRYEVQVDIDGATWRVFSADPPLNGTRVGLRIDPANLALLSS